jgi:putative transposase
LNLRIKPRKRLVHNKPAALTLPGGINEGGSADFMHDTLDATMEWAKNRGIHI